MEVHSKEIISGRYFWIFIFSVYSSNKKGVNGPILDIFNLVEGTFELQNMIFKTWNFVEKYQFDDISRISKTYEKREEL